LRPLSTTGASPLWRRHSGYREAYPFVRRAIRRRLRSVVGWRGWGQRFEGPLAPPGGPPRFEPGGLL